jgi:hypothetical protein
MNDGFVARQPMNHDIQKTADTRPEREDSRGKKPGESGGEFSE